MVLPPVTSPHNSSFTGQSSSVYPQIFDSPDDTCSPPVPRVRSATYSRKNSSNSQTENTLFVHNIESAFMKIFQDSLHRDFFLLFDASGKRFGFHRAFLAPMSKKINSAIEKGMNELVVNLDASEELLSQLCSTCYGANMNLNRTNSPDLLLLAFEIGLVDQLKKIKDSLSKRSDSTYRFPSSEILKALNNDKFKDVTLKYRDVCFQGHRCFLTALSPTLAASSSSSSATIDFTDYLTVDSVNFLQFFESLYTGQISISLTNCYDIYKLGCFFYLPLKTHILSWIERSVPSQSWVFPCLLKADLAQDLSFLNFMVQKLNSIQYLSEADTLSLSPKVCRHFATLQINAKWLLRVIVDSFFKCPNKTLWTPEVLLQCLNAITLSQIIATNLYKILKPLFEHPSLLGEMVSFSVKAFHFYKEHVPFEWITWFLTSVNRFDLREAIHSFAAIIDIVITPANAKKLGDLEFSALFIEAVVQNCKESHVLLLVLKSAVMRSECKKLSTTFFDRLFASIDISRCKADDIFTLLQPLLDSEKLQTIVSAFVAKRLFVKVLEDRHK
ncbi:hypothetical protein RCL1_005326 [Eukaryota sp. TZLM3-RCL]